MFENTNKFYEKREEISFTKEATACGYKIGITSPFDFDVTSAESISSDIPDFEISNPENKDNNEFQGQITFIESTDNNLLWDEESKTLSILGKSADYASGHALIYKSIQVAEYLRQMEGQLTTHGSAVRFSNGKAIIIMGNSGAGKTSAAISLCQNYGAELIGNDQIVFDTKDNLKVVGGTKDLVVRKVVTKQNFPELAYLFDTKENSWKSKRKLKPEELGIVACAGSSDVCAVVWIHLDADQTEPTYVKKILPVDIIESLNIAERFSRQISGVQSPLIDDHGVVRAFGISLDNDTTRKNRVTALEKFRETGIYYVFGSKIEEVSSAIQHLSEYEDGK